MRQGHGSEATRVIGCIRVTGVIMQELLDASG